MKGTLKATPIDMNNAYSRTPYLQNILNEKNPFYNNEYYKNEDEIPVEEISCCDCCYSNRLQRKYKSATETTSLLNSNVNKEQSKQCSVL